ncbi:hypothetical protein D3C79_915730 [compost metagenome]
MVGMQDQNTIHGAFQHRVHHVLFARCSKHHAQEVTGVGQIVAWINKRLTERILVTHRCHGRHFGQQAERGDLTVTFIVDVQRIVIERSQGTCHAAQHRHWV